MSRFAELQAEYRRQCAAFKTRISTGQDGIGECMLGIPGALDVGAEVYVARKREDDVPGRIVRGYVHPEMRVSMFEVELAGGERVDAELCELVHPELAVRRNALVHAAYAAQDEALRIGDLEAWRSVLCGEELCLLDGKPGEVSVDDVRLAFAFMLCGPEDWGIHWDAGERLEPISRPVAAYLRKAMRRGAAKGYQRLCFRCARNAAVLPGDHTAIDFLVEELRVEL